MKVDQVFQVSGLRGFEAIALSLTAKSREFAAAGLNNMAFAFKNSAPAVIGEHRKIRNQSFIRSRFLVEKAKPGSLATMSARAGSIRSPRFDGFASDYGEVTEDNKRANRSIGLNARGGDMDAQAKLGARMRTGTVANISNYANIPGSWSQKCVAMISIMARSAAPGTPFILAGGPFRAGLYVIDAKASARIRKASKKGTPAKALTYMPRIKRLQTFDSKPKRFKHLDWAHIAIDRVNTQHDALWANAFKHVYS